MSEIIESKEAAEFPVGKMNFIIIIAGVIVVLLGFVLMAGGGSEDPNVFNEEIFSPMRITVAPITILIGYIVVMFGIMKK